MYKVELKGDRFWTSIDLTSLPGNHSKGVLCQNGLTKGFPRGFLSDTMVGDIATDEPPMLQFMCLPTQVSNWLQVLRPMFRHRHHLVFCWLLVCQAVYQEKATVKGLARLAPRHIAEWHLRRLLTTTSWNARLLGWFADQVIATLPPPEDGCVMSWRTVR